MLKKKGAADGIKLELSRARHAEDRFNASEFGLLVPRQKQDVTTFALNPRSSKRWRKMGWEKRAATSTLANISICTLVTIV